MWVRFCCTLCYYKLSPVKSNSLNWNNDTCSDEHPESVLTSMKTIMTVLLEESEDIHEDLVLILLSVLGQNKNVSTCS